MTDEELSDEAAWRALLGSRVTLRFRLGGDPAHPFSEAIGVVRSVGEGRAVVVDRRGKPTEVPLADILAAKVLSG
ncbi:MAG TPA: hypothetical protein VM573_09735 [Actinomycetota bacterium]|nr:hypothetical protein [Actinomycetota bacterium]